MSGLKAASLLLSADRVQRPISFGADRVFRKRSLAAFQAGPAFSVCLLFRSRTKLIRQLVLGQFVSLSRLFTHFLHNADVTVDIVRWRYMVMSGRLDYHL